MTVGNGHRPSGAAEPDLGTSYLGLRLRCPVVASSSPLTGDLPSLRALDLAGVGAVVLPSLFEEQLEHEAEVLDQYLGLGSDVNPEITFGYAPRLDDYNQGSVRYLKLVRDAKAAL